MSEDQSEIIRTTCGGGGNAGLCSCGVLLYIKNGKLVKVEGDPEYPYNKGRMCIKGLSVRQVVHHPDRILYPMKRVGGRGEGKWQRISWEEAFDTIERKLNEIKIKYGPEAVVFHTGTGRGMTPWISKLSYSFGSPNWITPGFECHFPLFLVTGLTFGNPIEPYVDYSHQFPDRYNNPKWRKPECVIVWGCNTIVANAVCFGHWLVDLMRIGTRLIVVDPRLTWLASKAEIWLQIRPGTDAALALSMLHVIMKEKLYDKEFIKKWTNAPFLVRCDTHKLLRQHETTGEVSLNFVVWDSVANETRFWNIKEQEYNKPNTEPVLEGEFDIKLADGSIVRCKTVWQMLMERVEEYPPEKVSEITWIPSRKIVDAARLFATNTPAAIDTGVSTDHTSNAFQSCRARALLMAVTGNWDVPGGWTSEKKAWNIIGFDGVWGFEELPASQAMKFLGMDKYSLSSAGICTVANPNDAWDAILTGKPYPVKAFISIGGGCVLSSAENIRKVYQALAKVDFIVQTDLFPSPMTEIADIVLPAASWVERDNLKSWWGYLSTQNKAIKIGDVKSDIEIICELGSRLCPEKWPWRTPEELFDWCLQPINMNFKDLKQKTPIYAPYEYRKYEKGLERRDGKPGFNTPSGKVEIWSSLVEIAPNVDPLPCYFEPPESPYSAPWLAKEYPLILITGGRIWGYFHSEGRQIPWMRELHPDPLVEIHPETAAELGIMNGDWVYVETRRGRCKMKAMLSVGMHPKVVRAEHNWWYPEKLGKAPLFEILEPNVNFCTDDEHYDPALGSRQLRAMLCKIYKA